MIRIALPKGRLLPDTAALARESGWELSDYSDRARLYRLTSGYFSDLNAKIFHEKDIPIQVAMGNYDLGICGLDWIEELTVKYPASGLVKVADLAYGRLKLYLAAGCSSGLSTLKDVRESEKVLSIASEYPNLAESLALNNRFKNFNIFPVWGAAEIYPPENADLVLIADKTGCETANGNLHPIIKVLDSSAYLIANKSAWETRDMSQILRTLNLKPVLRAPGNERMPDRLAEKNSIPDKKLPLHSASIEVQARQDMGASLTSREKPAGVFPLPSAGSIALALPDGHAQKHVVNILSKSGLRIRDYPAENGNRRPEIEWPAITIKVIRPQDMPLQVANGKFDIAITGRDWVREHLYKFPSSPVTELLDLKYSRVKIVAAIHESIPAEDIAELRIFASERGLKLRVASEYVSIADKYARDHHLGMYRIIPTWGATEAFLPDDADILIENTETGGTLKRHNLKIIETLFESTACVIANTGSLNSPKAPKIKAFSARLQEATKDL